MRISITTSEVCRRSAIQTPFGNLSGAARRTPRIPSLPAPRRPARPARARPPRRPLLYEDIYGPLAACVEKVAAAMIMLVTAAANCYFYVRVVTLG